MLTGIIVHAGVVLRPQVEEGWPTGQERSAAAILVNWESGLLEVPTRLCCLQLMQAHAFVSVCCTAGLQHAKPSLA